MSEQRGSSDEGLWMILCVLLLLLLAGAGGFVWIKQREASRMIAAEQMAREAAEMNQMQAAMALERAAAAADMAQMQADIAQAARAQAAASRSSAAGRPLIPELYLNQDLWRHVNSLTDAEPDAHVFTIDVETGELRFGDGQQGASPPVRPVTLQATYETAGGGTVTVSLPTTDLRTSRVRATLEPDGVLRLEVSDTPPDVASE